MDANWFLSASAQTAGAIVAVVGGFVASRLVAQSAERNGLQSRHSEIGRSLASLRLEEKEASRALDEFLRGRFRKLAIDALVGSEEEGLGAVVARFGYEGGILPEDACRAILASVRDEVSKAHNFLDARVPQEYYGSLDRVVSESELTRTGIARDALEAVFEAVANSRRGVPIYHNVLETTADQQLASQQRLHLERRLQDLRSSADRLEGTQREVENRLLEIGQPGGLARVFVPLCYLGVFGILLPLSLLLVHEGRLPIWAVASVLGVFAAGVVWMLVSLFLEWRSPVAGDFLKEQHTRMRVWQERHGIPWSRRRYEPPDPPS